MTPETPRDESADTPPKSAPPARVFPCRNCGAALRFAPGVGRLTCSTCGTQNDLPAVDEQSMASAHEELDFRAALARQAGNEPAIDAQLVECPQCGAQTRFDPSVVASVCAFCATPLVSVRAHTGRQIQPRGIVPFTLEPASAQQLFRKWIEGRWFAPNALRKTVNQAQGVRGVYVPCWTYDAETTSEYDGQRGEHRTEYHTERDAQGREVTVARTVTDWYSAYGTVRVDFDDTLILASATIPEKYATVLEGWDVSKLVPFSDDYVAGFTVEAYQLGLEAGFEKAQAIFADSINDAVRRDIGGDEQRVGHVATQYGAIRFKHLLLPVWIASYKFANKSWRVVVNGQTGSVKGDRPYSPWKIGFAILVALAVVVIVASLSQQR